MNIKQSICDYLRNHPEGVDDDVLAAALQLPNRQEANSYCRNLEKSGLVIRRRVGGKIHNFLTVSAPKLKDTPITRKLNDNVEKSTDWFWEGNIQSKIIEYLVSNKCQILSVADTESRQTGIDITAKKNGLNIWISVKGYPRETEKTKALTQAGHWFKDVIFDVLRYRQDDAKIIIGVGLPDFPRYRNLASSISWFKNSGKFTYFWVNENGEVRPE